MPDDLLIEQFHLDVFVPRRLPVRQYDAMRRTLAGKRFRARLLRAIRTLFRKYRSLRDASLDVSV
jgi:hypothetical protein